MTPKRKATLVCVSCNSKHSLLWRTNDDGRLCHECYRIDNSCVTGPITAAAIEAIKADYSRQKEQTRSSTPSQKPLKKRVTATRTRSSTTSGSATGGAQKGSNVNRNRGRRSIFKREPFKAPSSTATVITSDSVYYNGMIWNVGDIVSLFDVNGDTYYAQLRGFMTDQYCEKSAVITWLIPTTESPPPSECFDPSTYIIGPEEDLSRKLKYMTFIMRAPSDYFKCEVSPYPTVEAEIVTKAVKDFVWTSMDPHYNEKISA